ncbi:hypothetical protein GO988_07770 [Hymenobacter sp. HMF4947]|uniref:YfhO family protein n=1 Tax=Hymenobacter ginkgonis TaxID=2682976 RepID=A0A7K1TCU8_9BACT|nr:DUF6056 family protein [Hymenobacter ginkgonis]MVN76219.1 hypothetical protein [Hymenobacter ginkgonis]
MIGFIQKHRWRLLKLVFSLLVFPFIGLSYYNQPYSDDFVLASLVRKQGFWGANREFFLTWSGRFFTNACYTGLNPLNYGWLPGMALPVLVGLLLKVGIVTWALHSLAAKTLPASTAGWLAGGLVLLHTVLVPDLYSAVYYFTDLVVYQLPALLLVLVPVAVARAHRAPTAGGKRLALAAAGAGTVAVAGSNELTIALLGWLLLAGFGLSCYQKKGSSARIWLVLGVVLLLGASFALRAPGNFSRLGVEAKPTVGVGLVQVVARLAKAVKLILLAPELHAMLLVPLLLAPLGVRLLPARPTGLRMPLVVSAGFLLLGLVVGCLPYMVVWEAPVPTRAVNVLMWWLLLGWVVACWAALPATTTASAAFRFGGMRLVASLVLAAVVVATSVRAWQELLLDAPAYARQWEARYQLFQRAAQLPGPKELTIAPMLNVTPRYVMIRGYDIQPSYHFYTNVETAAWFGLDSVRTDARQLRQAAF